MAQSLKAIVVEVTGGNVRNSHIYLKEALGFFPADAVGGSNAADPGKPIVFRMGGEEVETDLDGAKAIIRDRGAMKRFFEREHVAAGDLILIERLGKRLYEISKASKRAFKYHL